MVLEDTFYCLDGDFPSQLQQHYLKTGSDPLWPSIALLEDRKAVIKSHRDFLRAGKIFTILEIYFPFNPLY